MKMKLSTALTIFVILTMPLVVWPVVKPRFDELQRVVADCVETRQELRTKDQQERCKDHRRAWLIPGVL